MKSVKDKVGATLQLWLYEIVTILEPNFIERLSIQLHVLRKHYNSRASAASFAKHCPMLVLTVVHESQCGGRTLAPEACSCTPIAYAVTLRRTGSTTRSATNVLARKLDTSAVDWRPTHHMPEDDYA